MNIHDALLARYAPPEWALFFEVRNGTGFTRKTRYADAIAMNLYPSRGLAIHGFEFKASRSDWLVELKNPDKAESICRYCDYWWLVVTDKAIVGPGELPDTWGLLAPRGETFVARVEAAKRQPYSLDRHFFASLCRSASAACDDMRTTHIPRTSIDDELKQARANAIAEYERTQKVWKTELDKVLAQVQSFQSATGIPVLSSYITRAELNELRTVRMLAQHAPNKLLENLDWIAQAAKRLHDDAATAATAFRARNASENDTGERTG